jgi:hypothetical protein
MFIEQETENPVNLFDSFLLYSSTRREVNQEQAWQSIGSNRRQMGELLYDPTSPGSIVRYLEKELAPQLKLLERQERCAHCRRPYQPKNNFGKHGCFYHPLTYDGKNRCCGKPLGSVGCQRGDHRSRLREQDTLWTWTDNTILLPYHLAPRWRVPAQAIVKTELNHTDPARSYLIVSRVGERIDPIGE